MVKGLSLCLKKGFSLKKRYLLIDDLRSWQDVGVDPAIYPDVELVVARTYDEGLSRIKEGGLDWLFLDHDLGEFGNKTGYELICFIEANPELTPNHFECVSANPVGVAKINAAWQSILRRAP